MPLVQVLRTVSLKQIDIPDEVKGEEKEDKPKKLKRSVKGSLHFVPGSTKVLTKDEFDFIKKEDKEFADKLLVISKDVDSKEVKKKKKEKPKKTVTSNDDKDDKKDKKSDKKSDKK